MNNVIPSAKAIKLGAAKSLPSLGLFRLPGYSSNLSVSASGLNLRPAHLIFASVFPVALIFYG